MDAGGAFSWRLAGMMRNFYWYCVSLMFGAGGGGNGEAGRSPAGRRQRRLRQNRDVTIRSIGGYEVISFRDEAPPPPPLVSSANSAREVGGHGRRREAAEAQQPTASFRLVNRLSKEFIECSDGRLRTGSYGRNKDRHRPLLDENKDYRFGGDRRRNRSREADKNKYSNLDEKGLSLTPDCNYKDRQGVKVRDQSRKVVYRNQDNGNEKAVVDKDLQRVRHGDDGRKGRSEVKRSSSERRRGSGENWFGNKDSTEAKDLLPKNAGRQLRMVRQEEWMMQRSAKSTKKLALNQQEARQT